MKHIIINMLAFATLLSAVLVITSKNPVISVIFLIGVFCSAALYLIMCGVHFIGISYIIIYVGAIAVIFLFIIMMINIKLTDIVDIGSQFTKNVPLAIMIGSLFMYEMYTILPFTFNNVSFLLDFITKLNNMILNPYTSFLNTVLITYNPIIADMTFTHYLHIQAVGQHLYTYGAILLIILSMILLLAMVAPIFISSKN